MSLKKQPSINYEPLKTEFDKLGFHFRQIVRDGDIAIFEKTKDTGYKGYETIVVQYFPERVIGGVTIVAKEGFPSSEQWGVEALTSTTYIGAVECFEKLKNSIDKKNGKV